MANPVFVDCPANTWKKVATNVTLGSIHKISVEPKLYFQTYKNTGEAPPILRNVLRNVIRSCWETPSSVTSPCVATPNTANETASFLSGSIQCVAPPNRSTPSI